MNREELAEVLELHLKWLAGGNDGKRANLRGADLCGANLCDANLCGADLCGADLCGANLCDADLCGANLCGANLRGADLCGANLCDADLCGANLWDCAGNRNEIKSLFVSEDYPIVYTYEHLQIGCERHEIKEWWVFDNETIVNMDGKKALDFWTEWKEVIKNIIEKSPATQGDNK